MNMKNFYFILSEIVRSFSVKWYNKLYAKALMWSIRQSRK